MLRWFKCMSIAFSIILPITAQASVQDIVDRITSKEEFMEIYRPYANVLANEMPDFYLRARFDKTGKRADSGFVEIYRSDSSVRAGYFPDKESIVNPAHSRVASPERSFRVERTGEDKSYAITELSGRDTSNNYREFEKRIVLHQPIAKPWNAYFESTVESYLSRPDVQFEGVSESVATPDAITVRWRRRGVSLNGARVDQPVSYDFLPNRGWALSGYAVGRGPEANLITVKISYAVDEAFPPAPTVVEKNQVSRGKEVFRDTYTVEEFDRSRLPAQVFRLSAFGFDDGVGLFGWSSVQWLVGIAITLLVVGGAVAVYRRRAMY